MTHLTAAQRRYRENAVLFAATGLVFRQLEVDGVPIAAISDVAETESGGTPSRTVSAYYGGDIPWLKSGDLTDGPIITAEESITDAGLEHSAARVFSAGTVVIALYGATVGKTGILTFDAASNQAVCAVSPKDGRVSNEYLFWFLRHKRQDFLNASFGGAQPNISQRILRETRLPVPERELQSQICKFFRMIVERRGGSLREELPSLPKSLCRQRRIVAKIEGLTAKIDEAYALRVRSAIGCCGVTAAATSQMFDGLNGVRRETIGKLGIDGSNPVQTGPFGAQLHKTEFTLEGVPVLNVGNVWPEGLRFNRLDHVPEHKAQQLSRYRLQTDDLLFARSGATLGKVCLVPEVSDQWLMTGHLFRVRFDQSRCDPRFAFVALRGAKQVRDQVFGQVRGATRPGFNTTLLSRVELPLPPLSEQRRIVAYLDGLQAKVDELKRLQALAAAELDALLPAILDRAFKGQL